MPDSAAAQGAEIREDQPAASERATTSERDDPTTATDEDETHYMDEPASEDAEVHYTSTTEQDSRKEA